MNYYLLLRHSRYRNVFKWIVFMKLTILFACLALNVSAKVFSQEKVSLHTQNENLANVLRMIEQQTSYRFVYSSSYVPVEKNISISVKNASINEVLTQLLRGTNLGFSVTGTSLVTISRQEDITITGTVKNEQGEALIGASVKIKGSATGIATDGEGRFSIRVPAGGSVLVFSHVGYEDLEIPVTSSQNIGVVLKEKQQEAAEVVVIGYGTQKKINLSGAVAQVGGKDLVNRPVPNVTAALQGVVPGVTVTRSSGKPGAEGISFQVRGATSSNGASALVLVDGIEQNINLIDPNEVESISVLKDASASAIYGARAAAGVVLITTKKAALGKTRVTFNGYYGWNINARMPERLNSWDEQILIDEARANATGSPEYNAEQREWIRNPNLWYRPNPATDRWEYFANTNWIKEGMDKINHMQNYSLSVSGGTDKLNYLVMGSFYTRDGVLRYGPDNNDRYNLRSNINAELNKYISMKVNLGYISSVIDENSYGTDGIINLIYRGRTRQPLYVPAEDSTGQRYNGDLMLNPVDIENNAGLKRSNLENLTARLGFQVKNVVKGLTLDVIGWRNQGFLTSEAHNRSIFWYGRSKNTVRGMINDPNSITVIKAKSYQNNLQGYLTYQLNAGDDHHIKLMQGGSYEEYRADSLTTSVQRMFNNEVFNVSFGDPTTLQSRQDIGTWALASAFGRVNYDYKGRYFLEASYRYDGSSRLAPENRWQLFPSFSAAWRLGDESFIKDNLAFVNDLKLRGSWGELGNGSPLGYYPYLATLTSGNNLVFNNARAQYYYQEVLASPFVTWETLQQMNIGIDLALFRNRLQLTADYYVKRNKDMLAKVNLPSIIGVATPFYNTGELKSWGTELDVKWNDKWGDVTYNIGFNISDMQNKLVKYNGLNVINLDASAQGGITPLLEGYPLNTVWGYRTDGFFQTQQEADDYRSRIQVPPNASFPVKSAPGDIRYVDLNGDNKINFGSATPQDRGDLVYLGTTNPRYAYGFNMGLNWKGIDFSVFFQGVLDRKFVVNPTAMVPYIGTAEQASTIHMDRWTPDNPNAYFARMYQQASFNYLTSDRWTQNGNYLRLKNLQIGYKIPVKRGAIKDLRVYASGQDLWEHTKVLKIFDPEVPNDVRTTAYPFYRSVSVGLNMIL
ncbi:TonB-dependent receptor [Niabella sp. CC-SYL272]|uniref:TonB-dependent receptor n=1 Tax=Niabella agricola TaxID=2891571 RepID=UPI001F1B0EC5|nr:TonB-dependent receptor [Niabella agricola]MCF3109855.1 TonB-dependent receptor [Niabella agricola]